MFSLYTVEHATFIFGVVFFSKKERNLCLSLPFILFSRFLYHARLAFFTESIKAYNVPLFWGFRVDRNDDDEPRCLFTSPAAIAADGLLCLPLLQTSPIADSGLRHDGNVIDHPRARVFPGPPQQKFSFRLLLDVCTRFLSPSLSSLTSRPEEKEKDYQKDSTTTSDRQMTRLLNRGKRRRMTIATDPVAASLATACCRCSLSCSITAAADSGRRRLVLLSALWRESARELFRGVGFLGERAARDAIVFPASVQIADCVPAHTTASSSLDDRQERALSVGRLVPRRGDATGDFHGRFYPIN